MPPPTADWRIPPTARHAEPPPPQMVRLAPRPGERPEQCPICQDYVPHLRTHVNLQHLPWALNGISACCICSAQFGKRALLERHRDSSTPRPPQPRSDPPSKDGGGVQPGFSRDWPGPWACPQLSPWSTT